MDLGVGGEVGEGYVFFIKGSVCVSYFYGFMGKGLALFYVGSR